MSRGTWGAALMLVVGLLLPPTLTALHSPAHAQEFDTSCAPLDIAILIDDTGSMGPAIANVKSQVADLVGEVEKASAGDYRIGLLTFGEQVRVRAPFAAGNADAIRGAVRRLGATGGGDAPEAWDEALVTAVDNRSARDVPRGRQVGNFDVPWRPEAKKMIVIITDARPAGFDDTYGRDDQDRAYAAAVRASSAGIRVATVFVPNGNQEDDAPSYLQFVSNLAQSTYFATSDNGSNLTEGLTLTVSTCALDSDGDGLFDRWEVKGYDADGDGTIDVDLPAMGADPQHKDLFVQVNWMQPDGARPCYFIVFCEAGPDGPHPPDPDSLADAVTVFAKAPVSNPDGKPGIRLHVDAGSFTPSGSSFGDDGLGGPIPIHPDVLLTGDDAHEAKTLKELEDSWFDPDRAAVFTWVVYTHRIRAGKGLFGLAPGVPGDTVLMAGANIDSQALESRTLVHELGHTLGLRHGGLDDANYKANYLSIMNYEYTLGDGLTRNGKSGVIDFSSFELADLDESDLDERAGLTLSDLEDPQGDRLSTYKTTYYCLGGEPDNKPHQSGVSAIDYNCDGDSSDHGLSGSINGSDDYSLLTSRDDWATLTFTGGSRGGLESAGDPGDETGFDREAWITTPKQYAVGATGPGAVSTQPGVVRLPFVVTNLGTTDDTYDLSAAVDGEWTGTAAVAESVDVAAGEAVTIPVSVTIDPEAESDASSYVTLSVQSRGADYVNANPIASVVIGEVATPSTGVLKVVPRKPLISSTFTVKGKGFAPGADVVLTSKAGTVEQVTGVADARGAVTLSATAPGASGTDSLILIGDSRGSEPQALKAEVTFAKASHALLYFGLGFGGFVLLLVAAGLIFWRVRRGRTPVVAEPPHEVPMD